MGFLDPSTTRLGLAPCWSGIPNPTPGSAHRLSQPLSGLLARPSSTALFHAASRPWAFSFRVFPSQGSRTPLRAASLLAVVHQRAETHPLEPYHRRFLPTPTQAQSPGIPRRLRVPFSRAEARFLVALDTGGRNRFVPPASPTSRPCSPYESVRPNSGCPSPGADTLLDVLPLQRLRRVSPRNLYPPEPLGPGHRFRP
jgi:hypothetical protein